MIRSGREKKIVFLVFPVTAPSYFFVFLPSKNRYNAYWGLFHPWRPKLAVKVAFAASMNLEKDFFDRKHLKISKNKFVSGKRFFSSLSASVKSGQPKYPGQAVKRDLGAKSLISVSLGSAPSAFQSILNLKTHSLNVNCDLSKKIQQNKKILIAFQPLRKLHIIKTHRFVWICWLGRCS